ncbi:hypothetical protein GCM10010412_067240 [Nonomuraea recticatena]|uniref:Uncharacterized protein n=1 Tax=Nonomuraea recticatena TaxID=46178 RepID=A0ABP6F824_9ACTN
MTISLGRQDCSVEGDPKPFGFAADLRAALIDLVIDWGRILLRVIGGIDRFLQLGRLCYRVSDDMNNRPLIDGALSSRGRGSPRRDRPWRGPPSAWPPTR